MRSQRPRESASAKRNFRRAVCGKLAWKQCQKQGFQKLHLISVDLRIKNERFRHYCGTIGKVRLRTGFYVHENQRGDALHAECCSNETLHPNMRPEGFTIEKTWQ